MTSLIAGASSGIIMASVFVCVGILMMLPVVKNPSPAFLAIFEKFPPGNVATTMVFLAYPVWGVVGVVMGLLYRISSEQAPGPGLGSPNMTFTLAVIVATSILASPFAILLRQAWIGVLTIVVAFIGLFGWFLPFFAA